MAQSVSMKSRFSEPHINRYPKAWQIAAATLAGVGIGLTAMHFMPAKTGKSLAGQTLSSKHSQSKATPANPLEAVNLWPKLDSRMNVLLMGVDSNGRDTERFNGCRSDTIILASLDPETKKVSLISIPRDSRVRINPSNGKHTVEKINAAHAIGGPELTVQTVSEDFGVPIDHYMVIDVQGLKQLFEALGPVEVMVEKPMHYRDRAGRLNIALEPGLNKLDATRLEEYVRFRHDPRGDIGRIERQQWFLRQVKKKLEEPQVLLKLPELCKLAGEYVRTDLEPTDMLKLAAFCKDLKTNQIQTATLPGEPVTINGGSYWVPTPDTSALVLHRMAGAPLSVSVIATNTGAHIHAVHNSDMTSDLNDQSSVSYAAYSNDLVNSECAQAAGTKPPSVVVKYPKGCEETARNLEGRLKEKGYNVRWIQKADLAECQHELLVQTSFRADDQLTLAVKQAIPELEAYPVNVSPEPRSSSDFVIVVTPGSKIVGPTAKETEEADLPQKKEDAHGA